MPWMIVNAANHSERGSGAVTVQLLIRWKPCLTAVDAELKNMGIALTASRPAGEALRRDAVRIERKIDRQGNDIIADTASIAITQSVDDELRKAR